MSHDILYDIIVIQMNKVCQYSNKLTGTTQKNVSILIHMGTFRALKTKMVKGQHSSFLFFLKTLIVLPHLSINQRINH